MFEDEISEIMRSIGNDKYKLVGYNTNDYLNSGFSLEIKPKYELKTTKNSFKFGSADAFIVNGNIIVRGFGNDIIEMFAQIF